MEETGTPIRIDINSELDKYIIVKQASWTARVDESLPAFELTAKQFLDEQAIISQWPFWMVNSEEPRSSRIIFDKEGRQIEINLEFYEEDEEDEEASSDEEDEEASSFESCTQRQKDALVRQFEGQWPHTPIEPEVLRCERMVDIGTTTYQVAYLEKDSVNAIMQAKWIKYGTGPVIPDCVQSRSQYDTWMFDCEW